MFTEITQEQVKNFGESCIISLSSNVVSMDFAQMDDFYERASLLFNFERKSGKSRKQA